MQQRKEKFKIWLILLILSLLFIAFAAGMLIKQSIDRKKSEDTFEELQNEINDATEISEPVIVETTEEETEEPEDVLTALGIKVPEKDLDWDALHEECEDIYAWIYVPDTTVDYPVLQHPTDNSYYLNYNMDGTRGFPGCIYTEDYNRKDFSDVHTVIYGHNLKDKTMFTSLHNFENEELFEKEHYIFIYTEDYVFVYQIFAAYEYPSIHLLDNYDFTNEYVYADFLKQIYATQDRVANVKKEIRVTTDDQILTLSTCTRDSNESLRFLVTGVLINPRKQGA